MRKSFSAVFLMLAMVALVVGSFGRSGASSHREAPMISQDPTADTTDLYAFVSPDAAGTVTLIANWIPLEAPYGGPNFYRFDDNARYEIHIDNDGNTVADVTYRFTFKTKVMNPKTFLYNTGPITSLDDPDWNVRQTYTITRVDKMGEAVILSDVISPPVNVGAKSTPDYGALARAAVVGLPNNGGKVFAGQRDDPFFVDLAAVFDLLTIRKLPGNAGGGVDGLKGYNVHTIALQVPFSRVTRDGSTPSDPKSAAAVIGVWATTSRQSTKVINPDGTVGYSGEWRQISRLGHPLVNEAVMSLELKDTFNAVPPSVDRTVPAVVERVTDPELAKLFTGLYGIKVPPAPRQDLVTIFLTGIPGLNQPPDVTPAEMLRLNLALPGKNGSPLGVLANDTSGFPNGRRLADDVTDIALKVVAGAAYPLLADPNFKADPIAAQLGDGVDANDKAFLSYFPYVSEPHPGIEGAGAMPLPDTAIENDSQYFPETGYALGGTFLKYWRDNGGLPIFGYPISSEARVNGRITQMFERNRFELHPDNAAPYHVLLGRLGAEVLEKRGINWQDLPTVSSAPQGCMYFGETRHSVCGSFMSYWKSHGLEFDGAKNSKSYAESLALFGLPLSQPFEEKNAATGETYMVQYFERARLEYHPENAGTQYEVLMGLLTQELGY